MRVKEIFDKRNILVCVSAICAVALLSFVLAFLNIFTRIEYFKLVTLPHSLQLGPQALVQPQAIPYEQIPEFFKAIFVAYSLLTFIPTLIGGSIIAVKAKHHQFNLVVTVGLVWTLFWVLLSVFSFLNAMFLILPKLAVNLPVYEQYKVLQLKDFSDKMYSFPQVAATNLFLLSIPQVVNALGNRKKK